MPLSPATNCPTNMRLADDNMSARQNKLLHWRQILIHGVDSKLQVNGPLRMNHRQFSHHVWQVIGHVRSDAEQVALNVAQLSQPWLERVLLLGICFVACFCVEQILEHPNLCVELIQAAIGVKP